MLDILRAITACALGRASRAIVPREVMGGPPDYIEWTPAPWGVTTDGRVVFISARAWREHLDGDPTVHADAVTHRDNGGPLTVLRRVGPLVFAWEVRWTDALHVFPASREVPTSTADAIAAEGHSEFRADSIPGLPTR